RRRGRRVATSTGGHRSYHQGGRQKAQRGHRRQAIWCTPLIAGRRAVGGDRVALMNMCKGCALGIVEQKARRHSRSPSVTSCHIRCRRKGSRAQKVQRVQDRTLARLIGSDESDELITEIYDVFTSETAIVHETQG